MTLIVFTCLMAGLLWSVWVLAERESWPLLAVVAAYLFVAVTAVAGLVGALAVLVQHLAP